MKTTLDIQDESPARAKRYAKITGCPLRKVVEDGLREVLTVRLPRRRYRLPDQAWEMQMRQTRSKSARGRTCAG